MKEHILLTVSSPQEDLVKRFRYLIAERFDNAEAQVKIDGVGIIYTSDQVRSHLKFPDDPLEIVLVHRDVDDLYAEVVCPAREKGLCVEIVQCYDEGVSAIQKRLQQLIVDSMLSGISSDLNSVNEGGVVIQYHSRSKIMSNQTRGDVCDYIGENDIEVSIVSHIQPPPVPF